VAFRSIALGFALVPSLTLGVALAQDAQPRSKASDYPVHATLPGMEIGAEYLVHSIPAESGMYFGKEYLVVDVGIFPDTKGGPITTSARRFTLKINGGKIVLDTDSPGTVAASLKYPDWEQRRNVTAQAGPVILGAPPAVGRFPGDPRPTQGRLPPAPRVPEQPDPSGEPRPSDLPIDQQIARIALPEGSFNEYAKGCLFFRFTGKMKSIRSLELVYDTGDKGPKATLALL